MEYGLIGKKLGHSFSKTIHEKIGGYNYALKELNEEQFHKFMIARDFKAINVTIPYKEKVIPYLDYISPTAKKINAVNTVVMKNGKMWGYNTDYAGFKEMLQAFCIDVKDKNALILGTGGTSKTVYEALNDLGAKAINFVSRSPKDGVITYDDLPLYYDSTNIIVNTTPCEMYPNNDKRIIKVENFKNLSGALDVVYNPLRTNFILSAKNMGVRCCSGLYMLIAQAVYAIEIFLDKAIDKTVINKVYKELLNQKENLVLIGMPSSGKSSIGRLLAQKTQRPFFDTDEEIVKKINMDIPCFFEKYGEEKFREVESQTINQLSKNTGCIIATGGGGILKDENVRYLKQNGKLIFLDRPLDKLVATNTRPLSSSAEKLQRLYEARYSRYLAVCDKKIDCDKGMEEVADSIYEVLL